MSYFKNNHQIGEFVKPESGDAYFFFPHAIEKGILDVSQLEPSQPQEAALTVRNAKMPTQAGTIELSNGKIAAYDLVSGKFDGNNLIIAPSNKNAVETVTREVVADGLLTLCYGNGFVKVFAEVVDEQEAEWMNIRRRVGRKAVNFLGIDAPIFEVSEIKENITVAKPKLPIFSTAGLLK